MEHIRLLAGCTLMFIMCMPHLTQTQSAQEESAAIRPPAVFQDAAPIRIPDVTRDPNVLRGLKYANVALQALDTHSTARALAAGAVEANVLLKPFAGSMPAFAAVKAGTTYVMWRGIGKIAKRHPRVAFLIAFASDAALTVAVVRNYKNAAALR